MGEFSKLAGLSAKGENTLEVLIMGVARRYSTWLLSSKV
jgi:hypothetical protein